MGQQLNAGRDEALLIARIVNAWSAAQNCVEQLTPVLKVLGLLKKNGQLDVDRVVAAQKAARGEK